jgi:two-component sensor histidine kinase
MWMVDGTPQPGGRLTDFPPAPDETADFRQLRHQTKNALQRILSHVHRMPDLTRSPHGQRLAAEVERRIRLSAMISDALFGLVREPLPLQERLRLLCEAMVDLYADPEQTIRWSVTTSGVCPPRLHNTVVRVAHELLGNAIQHGMHMRLLGRIEVHLVAEPDKATTLTISDDGWGTDGRCGPGQGLTLARELAAEHDGILTLRRTDLTIAELHLPAASPDRPLAPIAGER